MSPAECVCSTQKTKGCMSVWCVPIWMQKAYIQDRKAKGDDLPSGV